ncbi:M57 family metalloprotease [Nocardioides sp. NPDC006273]|uniref:M57 family metalloprotease n=1 Tax=Nocardioides sp. NPDC006273 TaxID=3155598 RepID=UPI0033B2CCF0
MRVRIPMMIAAAAGAAALTASMVPASAQEAPSYREFEASTYVDVDGQYVVNGDEVVSNQGDLHKFYESMVSTPKHIPEDGLIVNTVSGKDDKWSASQALNLTYCVSNKFGTDKAAIVTAMEQGAGMWEAASSKVDYIYVPSQDSSCNTRNSNVLFSVEPVNTTQYIARAFFPSTSKRSRNVLIDDSIFSSGSWEADDIIAHELGHTLGFRHEHTRPEAATCFEDNNWRALTPYDSSSIMHYPQCNGGSADLEFQSSDAAGVRALYGS